MNYEKKYKQALDRASKLRVQNPFDTVEQMVEHIFPEIKENESIKKDLIGWFEEFPDMIWRGHYKKDVLAWLEKRGKEEYALKSFRDKDVRKFMQYIEIQSKAYEFNLPNRSYDIYAFAKDILYWIEKQGEQTAADKTKKKFKVGNYIVPDNDAFLEILKVINIDKDGYYNIQCITNPEYDEIYRIPGFVLENDYHLWTIADAKDGDVLVCNINKAEIGGDIEKLPNITPTICIYQNVVNDTNYIHSYCSLYDGKSLVLQNTMYYNTFVYNIQPATKEQRELLFQKMKETGWEWDNEKKELSKQTKKD